MGEKIATYIANDPEYIETTHKIRKSKLKTHPGEEQNTKRQKNFEKILLIIWAMHLKPQWRNVFHPSDWQKRWSSILSVGEDVGTSIVTHYDGQCDSIY